MLAVPMQPGSTLKAGRPQVLFEAAMSVQGVGVRPYDVAPDGRFFIIRRCPDGRRRRHTIEHHRGAELVGRAEAPGADEVM